MGHYDFTTLPDRLHQHSVKWKQSEQDQSLLPMWIADMDFLPLPAIKEALSRYAEEHVFGYAYASERVLDSIVQWEEKEHGYAILPEHIVLIEGVVPAISVAIQAFTQPGDAVLINTPVYPPFARSVRLNNRKLVTNSLRWEAEHFEIDFDQLERDIVDHQVKLYVLCSPHNPGGRVWSWEELERIGRLCQRHHVLLVSDEIHQDLALFGHKHHSFQTVAEEFKEFSIVLSSATKTFNIAGTKNSFALIANDRLRKQFTRQQLANNQHEVPTVGLLTTEAAFREGRDWLQELKVVLETNITFAVDYLREYTDIRVMKPEGTYLIWLDFSAYHLSDEELDRILLEEAKVVLNGGRTFGLDGKGCARFNIAAPLSLVQEACHRLETVFARR